MEVEDLHLRRTSVGGMTFAGFEGCIRYGRGGPHQYTQRQASKLAKKLPSAHVLLCHCPPLGINDDPEDPAHIVMEGLLRWVERHEPRHILHGHTHPIGPQLMTLVQKVVNNELNHLKLGWDSAVVSQVATWLGP